MLAGTPRRALVTWYRDPLPTNCVATWVCPGGTGAGYPTYAVRPGPEYGFYNLAVFYEACSFDCLFCQNWHFRRANPLRDHGASSAQLAQSVGEKDTCICFFGGDPGPQIAHALRASRLALNTPKKRPLRICWETNGQLSYQALRAAFSLSLETGGCIKFDLKAYSEPVHVALTGVSNQRVLQNFAWAARQFGLRPEPPPVVASTLLVPGYVTAEEVFQIAKLIASIDRRVPYSLLAFAPQFEMADLPPTSRQEAESCLDAAHTAGLLRVHLGNAHLLWDERSGYLIS
ncbi:MAG: radical SAM protein [candidate division KSB1 bacterium]|nr:radical SAM protein [candidate division KSB1 bacterium]